MTPIIKSLLIKVVAALAGTLVTAAVTKAAHDAFDEETTNNLGQKDTNDQEDIMTIEQE